MENNKTAEPGSNSAGGATTGQTMNGNGGSNPDPSTIPIPKLGMAPLSSELAVAAASNNIPAEILQPLNRPPPDSLQSADSHTKQTSMPSTVDASRPDPVLPDPTTVPAIPTTSEPEQAPQANEPPSSLPDTAATPPDMAPAADPGEQSQLPDPNPTPSDPPPPNSPTNANLDPPNVDSAPNEMS